MVSIIQCTRRSRHTLKFVDKVKVRVTGGRGGNGCVSYNVTSPSRKEPNGGSGGKGGCVYIIADKSLSSMRFKTFHFNAGHGAHGGSSFRTGRAGRDLYIRVPLGTTIREELSDDLNDLTNLNFLDGDFFKLSSSNDDDCSDDKDEVIEPDFLDLQNDGDVIRVAEGGSPGIGNGIMNRSKYNKNKSIPRTQMPGQNGEQRDLVIELKIIADVGLVGLPNVCTILVYN